VTEHELKCWPWCFAPLITMDKTFEVRFNDRGFKKGDTLRLREWDPIVTQYTGSETVLRVVYVCPLDAIGIPGFVGMQLSRVVGGR
jgi:Domain of unknown function (DUF3850)